MVSFKLFFTVFYYVLFNFGACKVRVRLKLGIFSDSNILKIGPLANPKVRVRLKLGVLRV